MMTTLNPYRRAGGLIVRRVAWDVKLESWRSRVKLKRVRDISPGGKAVIICNGPSLLRSDLGSLRDVFTFGLNKINLLFEDSTFRPSCVVAINPLVIEQNASFYRQTDIPLFIDSDGLRWVPPRPSITYLHSTVINGFARDCSISVYQGATVTYVALQLAFHMGFRQVALIGADHSFVTSGRPHETVTSGDDDPNHFDSRYFAGGIKWQLPDLAGSERSYILAREVFRSAGGRVVNATVGGQLEVFERLTLAEFLQDDEKETHPSH